MFNATALMGIKDAGLFRKPCIFVLFDIAFEFLVEVFSGSRKQNVNEFPVLFVNALSDPYPKVVLIVSISLNPVFSLTLTKHWFDNSRLRQLGKQF